MFALVSTIVAVKGFALGAGLGAALTVAGCCMRRKRS